MVREWRGRPVPVWILLGLLGTLALRGLVGGGQFIPVPSGDVVGVSTAVLVPTPVSDSLLPGLFLFVCLGVFSLAVGFALYRDRQWAWYGAIAVGLVLTGWAIVEGALLGFGERLQYVDLLQGPVTVVLALFPSVRESTVTER